MLSSAWAAVTVMPKLVANASPRTMCVARIASSLCCFHPARHLPPPVYDADALHRVGNCFVAKDIAPLIREWPHPQLLLSNLPQPGEPVRLDHQEEYDQRANDHELQVFDSRGAN